MSVNAKAAAAATMKLIRERYGRRGINLMRVHGDGEGGFLHMQYMARQIRDDVVLFDKAQRWLGFMQGCAVGSGLASVEEFKTINRFADTDRVLNEIKAERKRQVEEEGYEEFHDDNHAEGDLLAAAECYEAFALGTVVYNGCVPRNWPWQTLDWSAPGKTSRRCFIIAGALAMAENDRWSRLEVPPPPEPSALIQRCATHIEEIDRGERHPNTRGVAAYVAGGSNGKAHA